MAEVATPPPAQQKQGQAAPRPNLPGEVIIEIWDVTIPGKKEGDKPVKGARCRSALFPPARMHLRGRWNRADLLPDEASAERLISMPAEIPGQRISINAQARVVRIFDPLELPEYKRLFDDLAAKMAVFDGSKIRPQESVEHPNQSPSQIKTALWWAWKLVQAGIARVVQGQLPSEAEIKALPGKTRIELYSNSPRGVKFVEDLPREDWEDAQAAFLGAAQPTGR